MSKPIGLYWWQAPKGNFGDDLSPLIVEHYAQRPVRHASIKSCDMIAIGSLLGQATKRRWQRALRKPLRRTHIWGTGCFGDISGRYHHASVSGVRGPLTRRMMNLPAETPLGDPALLLPRILDRPARKHRWGLIPHIHHQESPLIRELAGAPGVHLIDLTSENTLEIARDIARCDFVLSSSLHGLIAADSFGVPNVWLQVGASMGNWKFEDYFQSVGRTASPITQPVDLVSLEQTATAADPGIVSRLADGLERSFPY